MLWCGNYKEVPCLTLNCLMGFLLFFSANFFESDVSASAGCGDEAQFAIDREHVTHMAFLS